ncbi:gamma-interferon-inducible lysosomal thiol reductase-like [Paramacrobiotus metropolitanus]|uniref:gamma-interferon-inducible lysosomal thiol reductase-like n=1 Tax=Paramacrobiotus metropolitanus TaxID=2943436 RepID=UPI00244597BC|nr:gamma-interferon-inducible lysosomal thiol reductase-like [Paramacrobiotus metropolitanus]
MVTSLRNRNNAGSIKKFWKWHGRPRYVFEAAFLLISIALVFLAYRYYFGESFDETVCGKPLRELCLLDDRIIHACKIAASCPDIKQQKEDENAAKMAAVPLVLVEVFYEVLCPDSKDFVIDQIYPTVQKIGGIVNISMVPFGKAEERKDGEEYIFSCQHGEKECKGNLVQTCAIGVLGDKDRNLAISFINCMEISHDPATSGPACAKDIGIDYKPIEACVAGKLGNQLQHIMAQRTLTLNPKLYWVPWVVLNGVHTEDIQRKCLADLRGVICDAYKGPKPPGCEDTKS